MFAVLAVSVDGAYVATILTSVSCSADTGSVYRRALRVILAVAVILAALAVGVKWTRPGAGVAVPPSLAKTLPSPRMAEFCVVLVALAHLPAIGSPESVLADAFIALVAGPARIAFTRAVDRRTRGAVFAGTIAGTIQAEGPFGTYLQALLIVETRFAFTLPCDVMAPSFVVAVAIVRAILAPEAIWTAIRAH